MRFLVIGECCTDIFVYGKCNRLSPEAPVPVFQPINEITNRGMAGNVASNLKSLIEKNEMNYFVKECLSDLRQIIKKRYVDKKSNHIFLRVDDEVTIPRIKFDTSLLNELNEADIIIISDYNKGFLSDDDLVTIRNKTIGKKIFLDTKRKLSDYIIGSFDYIKLNETEAENGTNLHFKENIIITLGNKGAKYMNEVFAVEEVETIDVSGAGDTFLAALAFEYSNTLDIIKAITFANKMASLVVKKRGVSII